MNHKQALEASKHNPAGVNKVLEKLKAKEISQKEMIVQAKESIAKKELGKYELVYKKDTQIIIAQPREWKWQPKIGEFYLLYGKLCLVTDPLIAREKFIWAWKKDNGKPTPILEWEEIERVLEKAGYPIKRLIHSTKGNPLHSPEMTKPIWRCQVWKGKYPIIFAESNTDSRQEAVMKAVLALGKELK